MTAGVTLAYLQTVPDRPNYITPAGYRALREEYEALYAGERLFELALSRRNRRWALRRGAL